MSRGGTEARRLADLEAALARFEAAAEAIAAEVSPRPGARDGARLAALAESLDTLWRQARRAGDRLGEVPATAGTDRTARRAGRRRAEAEARLAATRRSLPDLQAGLADCLAFPGAPLFAAPDLAGAENRRVETLKHAFLAAEIGLAGPS